MGMYWEKKENKYYVAKRVSSELTKVDKSGEVDKSGWYELTKLVSCDKSGWGDKSGRYSRLIRNIDPT